jgi:signal transduction histidine kinase
LLGIGREGYRPVSIIPLVQRTLALLRKPLQEAAVQVTTDLPADLPPVLAVPDQIGRVLLNLVLNTTEAMPDGGSLHITARVEREQLILNLVNDGPPIPAEHVENIFDPFFTTKTDSAGLGLFISHNIIQRHGGTMSVENLRDGRGVAFTLALPVDGDAT